MNLNNFFEKSLNEVKIFCDYVLSTNNFYERELLLYKFCPFQDISYDELIKTIELFEVKTIYDFIIILIYGLNYSDEVLLIINDVLTKYNFKENVNTFLKKGLHVQKRFQNSLNNNDIGIISEIMAYNYEKERLKI